MAFDMDAVDQELVRRGVPPQVLKALGFGAASQPATNAELRARAGGMPSGTQPVSFIADGGARRDLPAPIERLKENPQSMFVSTPVSFLRRADSPGASPQNNATARLSFTNRPQRGNPADLSAQGTRPVSFVNPEQGIPPTNANTPFSGDAAKRMMRAANQANAETSRTEPRSTEDEYRDLLKREPTRDQFPAEKMALWKKLLGAAASVAAGMGGGNTAGETARRFFGGPERRAEEKFEQAHGDWERNAGNLLRAAKLRQEDLQNRNLQSEIDKRDREKPDDPRDKKIDEGFNAKGQRTHVYQRPDGTEYTKTFPEIVQKQNAPEHKTPFEAYAYGTPDEKQSAQDFLDIEHKFQRKYRNPSEFDERYRLFQEDPETYKAMFGDKSGSTPDRRTATSMLNYFDKRRREVNGDFTLDDDQKQEQLKEIENLQRPFMDAVQPSAGRGGSSDRVEVIHPNGQRGTIPRSQLGAAKKKGYREAPQQ